MFDLDQAIAGWRRDLAAAGIRSADTLDELESHLRDEIDAQITAGAGASRAFGAAIQQIGESCALRTELEHALGTSNLPQQIKRLVTTLASLPEPCSLESMKTSASSSIITEPAWATYLKAAPILVPALGLWAFSIVFLLPKLRQIYQQSGIAAPFAHQAINALAQHFILLGGITALAVFVLERYSGLWRQYRPVAVGAAVVAVNSGVLVLLTLLLIFALVALPRVH